MSIDYSFGPQHDYRASPETRKNKAVEFFQAELPGAEISIHPIDKASAHYCIVIENGSGPEQVYKNLADALKDKVHSVTGGEYWNDGAEIYFHA